MSYTWYTCTCTTHIDWLWHNIGLWNSWWNHFYINMICMLTTCLSTWSFATRKPCNLETFFLWLHIFIKLWRLFKLSKQRDCIEPWSTYLHERWINTFLLFYRLKSASFRTPAVRILVIGTYLKGQINFWTGMTEIHSL